MPKIDLNNPLIALHSIPQCISSEKIILETSHAFFSDMTAKLLQDIGKHEPLKKIAKTSMEVVSAGGSICPEKPKPEPDPNPMSPEN
ncbi:MAG: hypothetical protein HGA90_05645, partial [Alphaproteobacteria bacterium]|nr:hypothetical protein [Alphaproteobacteria bacterium]